VTRVLDLRGREKDSYRHRWWVLRRDLGIEVEWLKVELRMLGLLKAKEGVISRCEERRKRNLRGVLRTWLCVSVLKEV
jgi:hypothetical protein